MITHLDLHEFHRRHRAVFGALGGLELVEHYGDAGKEHGALEESVALLDLGFRGRLCLTGEDRIRFLHGQVTNDVAKLSPGQGCYAALVTAKGKMESDLNIYRLEGELLLDFEPGLTAVVAERLERYIIADDVQVADIRPHYGMLSLQGPRAGAVWERLAMGMEAPEEPWAFAAGSPRDWGEVYIMRVPRGGAAGPGLDLYVPRASLGRAAEAMRAAVAEEGGCLCGWRALEIARVEAGRPRFGLDMDPSNLAPETGIEAEAIRYDKGCYIGQEVIARIRTYGRVAKRLGGFRLEGEGLKLPDAGSKLRDLKAGKEAGYLTSAVHSPRWGGILALGYVRKEFDAAGAVFGIGEEGGEARARLVELPYRG